MIFSEVDFYEKQKFEKMKVNKPKLILKKLKDAIEFLEEKDIF